MERLSDFTLTHLDKLARSFVDVDLELRVRLETQSKMYAEKLKLPYEVVFGIFEEGAVLFKLNSLIRDYREAREKV